MARGRIISFDGADGLGDIELEDGRLVRFGLGVLRVRERVGHPARDTYWYDCGH